MRKKNNGDIHKSHTPVFLLLLQESMMGHRFSSTTTAQLSTCDHSSTHGEKKNFKHLFFPTFIKGLRTILKTWLRLYISVSYVDSRFRQNKRSSSFTNSCLKLIQTVFQILRLITNRRLTLTPSLFLDNRGLSHRSKLCKRSSILCLSDQGP